MTRTKSQAATQIIGLSHHANYSK